MTEEKDRKKKTKLTIHGASNRSDLQREKNDFYATEPSAIDDLFEVEEFSDKIWEPACGQGHLSKRMERHGKEVYSTDLVDRGYGDEFFDFLKSNKKWNGDIITNPPFKKSKEFVEKSIEVIPNGKGVAMFLKITFLESEERAELFKFFPPKKIWIYSYRKNIAKGGKPELFDKGSAICYAWFVWERGYKENPEVGWITKNGELKFDFSKQQTLKMIKNV